MDKWFRVLVIVGVVSILLLGAFGAGIAAERYIAKPIITGIATPDDKADLGDQVEEVLGLLKEKALDPPKETSATAGAIQGLLDSTGDKYATYFDARHFKYFNEESSGEFGGIGVTIGEKDGKGYVVNVIPDTPAARAGMKTNDVFVQIDGVRRDKWSSEEIVKRVRGEVGTNVKLVVKRGEDLRTFNIKRAMIEVPNIHSQMLEDDLGYIRLYSFNQRTGQDVKAALKSLKKKGAKGFVIDLRDNPGGLLDQAIEMASQLIPEGVIVRVDERDKPEQVSHATGDHVTDAPVVLLVNENSASASEIVAGALMDHNRAKLVGQKTFGKGSVQTVEELSDGGAMKFTIAHYLTPKKRVINGKGLTPDYVVKLKPEQEYDPEFQKDRSKDAQLLKAIEVLKGEL